MRDLSFVPSPDTDDAIVSLADSAEISAILNADGNVSREDVARVLCRGYSVGEMSARSTAGDVFNELLNRLVCCDGRSRPNMLSVYPFCLEGNGAVLSVKSQYHRRAD